MNINLFGIQTSPAARALFSHDWHNKRAWLVFFITRVHFQRLYQAAVLLLACVGLVLLLRPEPPQFHQTVMQWSVFAYLMAIGATVQGIMHHFYIAAGLGYRCIAAYDMSCHPEMRFFRKKIRQRRRAQAGRRENA